MAIKSECGCIAHNAPVCPAGTTLAAGALGIDPLRCHRAWEADYGNRIRGRSGDIADQIGAMAAAQGIEPTREHLDSLVASYANFCDLAAAQALGVEPADLLFVGDGSDDELAGAARAGLTPALVEADSSDTYDPRRHTTVDWSGARLGDLSEVLGLVV